MNNKVIQSYVYYNGKRYFVSTIERDSSVAEHPYRYNETLVWEWKEDSPERGELLLQCEDIKGSIRTHLETCLKLYKNGFRNYE